MQGKLSPRKTGLELLSEQISQHIAGIIWLTDELINYETPGFYEVNYLLDGTLLHTLRQYPEEDRNAQNFFLGNGFGKSFFIFHSVVDDLSGFKQAIQNFKVATSLLHERKNVLILNKSKNTANIHVLKEFSKNYSNLKFEHLNA